MGASRIVEAGHSQTLLNRLNDQRKDGKYCDVHLKVAGQQLVAHSCVLAACSPFFQSVFERRNQISVSLTNGILELDVPGMLGPLVGLESGALEAMKGLLTYIYTGEIDLNAANTELVIQLADVVMLDGLSELARRFLQSDNLPRTVLCTPDDKSEVAQFSQQIFVRHSPIGAAHDPVTPKPTLDLHKISGRTLKQCRTVRRRRAKQNFVLKNVTQFKPLPVSHTDSRGDDADFENSEASFSLAECRRTFRCQQCSFVSNDNREIRSHCKVHCGKAYVCNSCGFIAFQAHELLDHMLEEKHSENKCSLCGFKAQTSASFDEHLHKHNDRKPFFCTTCSVRFRTRTALSLHLPKHAAALKQTVGPTCGQGSKRKPALQTRGQFEHGAVQQSSLRAIQCSHSESYHNVTSRSTELQDLKKKKRMFARIKLKPCQCEICGQKFSHANNKQIHARMHHFSKNLLEPSTQL